jgi:hypothetical protein
VRPRGEGQPGEGEDRQHFERGDHEAGMSERVLDAIRRAQEAQGQEWQR